MSAVEPPQAAEGSGRLRARLQTAYPGFQLDVDLDLPGRGVSVLLGPSGCGKTTVLRALAGLVRARGAVSLHGECWQDDPSRRPFVPTHQRPLGFVFQEASLFAHLSVLGNLQYGLKRTRPGARRIALEPTVALMGIGHLLQRRPEGLSGGERQRAAIARALLTSPRLLLMDEPLSALDPPRRAEILPYLERLPRELDLPIVYVTHAHDEAARLADHLVLMADGRVQAAGTPQDLLSRLELPLSLADDAGAVLQAVVAAHDEAYAQTRLQVGSEGLWVGAIPAAPGTQVRVRIAARDVSVALSRATDSSIANILAVDLAGVRLEGADRVMLRLRLAGMEPGAQPVHLLARITRRSLDALCLREGQPLFAQVKGVALMP